MSGLQLPDALNCQYPGRLPDFVGLLLHGLEFRAEGLCRCANPHSECKSRVFIKAVSGNPKPLGSLP